MVDAFIADLEKRIPFRRVMKQTLSKNWTGPERSSEGDGSWSIKRAEIARTEVLTNGKITIAYFKGGYWLFPRCGADDLW